MKKLLELRIPAYYKYLKIIKNSTDSILENLEIDNEIRYMLKLAVAEATANVIEHGYKGEQDSEIDYIIFKEEKTLKFILRDYGNQETLNNIKSRDLEDYKDGGLGVFIIENIMDEVRYEHLEKGTRLTMLKSLEESDYGK